MPDEYLPADVLQTIHSTITGTKHREYVKALYLLDTGIGQIVDKLTDKGMMDNTYVIFMSDNGGGILNWFRHPRTAMALLIFLVMCRLLSGRREECPSSRE